MQLATFLAPESSVPTAGEIRDGQVVTFETGSVLDRLTDRTPATGPAYPLDEVTLLEPIPRPPAIFCIGRNYAAHIAELGNERPEKPIVFLKLPLSSTRPGGPVRRPKATRALDYETELVLVMGPDNQIAGYAVANDVSARDLQRSEPQWSRAKGFDTSCPWGPWITTKDQLPDPLGLRVTTHVNQELRQDGNTRDLIFGPEELVAFISEACTLEPGALILTGTPSGVGEAFDPPRYLQPGDQVTCEIAGLGRLVHSVTEAT
jgi:2-keto-4-pentenoate hydratase/2-oxohepta-3-ene-1,7-dioic acid hydratase in catechol pathway